MLLVLFNHASLIGIKFPKFIDFDHVGVYGVQLFFVLSAYLLDRQIANVLLNQKSNKQYWLNYAFRRFLRIYPMLFLSLLLYHFLTMHVKGNMVFGHDITINDIYKHLLLQKGEGFYWSIPVEFKYYFLSPFLMLACHYWLKWDFKKVILFFISIMFVGMLAKYYLDAPKISTLNYLNVFLIGTVLSIADLLKQKELQEIKEKYGILIEATGIIAFIAIFATLNMGINAGYKNAILWGIILFATKYGYGLLRSVFSNLFLRLWGIMSFSTYLLHRAILGYVYHLSPFPNKTKLILFLLFSFVGATISYLLIEKPLSKIKLTSITNPKT